MPPASVYVPDSISSLLPTSVSLSRNRLELETTPFSSRMSAISPAVAPLGTSTTTLPSPSPPNGWNSATRNHTSAAPAASATSAAIRRRHTAPPGGRVSGRRAAGFEVRSGGGVVGSGGAGGRPGGGAGGAGGATGGSGDDGSGSGDASAGVRSEEHTSELQSRENLVCRLL